MAGAGSQTRRLRGRVLPVDSKAARYRKRAEELRKVADGLNDPTAQRELLLVSKQYDKLADDLERIRR